MYSFEHYSTRLGSRFRQRLVGPLLKILAVSFVLYLIVSSMFVAAFQIGSGSMLPGDRILASPLSYGARILFFSGRLPALKEPERGDLVVIRSPLVRRPSLAVRIFEPVVRFFTFQRLSLLRDDTGRRVAPYMVKRIVGLPGDTVSMSGFRAFITPKGSTVPVDEQQLLGSGYSLLIDNLPEGWRQELPFSGELPPLTLKEDEYFVLGDNRTGSSDSRSWGPILREQIVARVVHRYWPFSRWGNL
jgi:signal peptidase I